MASTTREAQNAMEENIERMLSTGQHLVDLEDKSEWLLAQATHAMIKSMISRESKWHPRYGVSPGYGSVVWNGVPDTLVATATAALEWLWASLCPEQARRTGRRRAPQARRHITPLHHPRRR